MAKGSLCYYAYQGNCGFCNKKLEELRHSQYYCCGCSPFKGMNKKTTSKHCPEMYRHMDNMIEKGYCEACGHSSELLKKNIGINHFDVV